MCVLLSLFWPTFQSLIYELVDEDGCSSSFDISTRITQCAGFSSIRMYDDHDEVSHWVKSEESEDCKHVFFWIFLARRSWYILKVSEPVSCILGTGKKYRYRYRSKLWVPSHSDHKHHCHQYHYHHHHHQDHCQGLRKFGHNTHERWIFLSTKIPGALFSFSEMKTSDKSEICQSSISTEIIDQLQYTLI